MIDDLEEMAHEIVMAYFTANGGASSAQSRPRRILFYRDGVSDGQFQEVLSYELPALRRAFSRLGDGSYNPPITYVVAKKRHHTRLFVVNERDGEGRNFNVPAGTVVDTGICHPHENDFFLQSHAGIQGTTRPVHYHVLADENKFGTDALQNLTFALCHLYCRCTRSVSLVPPVYYAHLAAARGVVYDKAASVSGSDTASSISGSGGGAVDAPTQRIDLSKKMLDRMFFA